MEKTYRLICIKSKQGRKVGSEIKFTYVCKKKVNGHFLDPIQNKSIVANIFAGDAPSCQTE